MLRSPPNPTECGKNKDAPRKEHRFHTRHDFSPNPALELYEVIRALARQNAIIEYPQIRNTLEAIASPLRQRRDLSKILATMGELGLLDVCPKGIRYNHTFGESLFGRRLWRRKFVSVVHSLYALGHHGTVADPRWSYREACRILTESAPIGISADELVMEVVLRAKQCFATDKVSFSRSSVGGIKAWLEALDPPLISVEKGRLVAVPDNERASSLVVDIVSTAVTLAGGSLPLDAAATSNLAVAMLVPPNRLRRILYSFLEPTNGIVLLDEYPQRLWRVLETH